MLKLFFSFINQSLIIIKLHFSYIIKNTNSEDYFLLQTRKIQVSELLLRAPLASAEEDAENNHIGE